MARYIILGAGAVGGALGGRLAFAGRGVVLVARGDHLTALQERGLRLRTPDEDVTQQLTAIGGPEEVELDVDDVLILATKTHQANDMLRRWTDAPGTPQWCMQSEPRASSLPIFTALNGVAGGGLRPSVLSAGVWSLRLDAGRSLGAGRSDHSQHTDAQGHCTSGGWPKTANKP